LSILVELRFVHVAGVAQISAHARTQMVPHFVQAAQGNAMAPGLRRGRPQSGSTPARPAVIMKIRQDYRIDNLR